MPIPYGQGRFQASHSGPRPTDWPPRGRPADDPLGAGDRAARWRAIDWQHVGAAIAQGGSAMGAGALLITGAGLAGLAGGLANHVLWRTPAYLIQGAAWEDPRPTAWRTAAATAAVGGIAVVAQSGRLVGGASGALFGSALGQVGALYPGTLFAAAAAAVVASAGWVVYQDFETIFLPTFFALQVTLQIAGILAGGISLGLLLGEECRALPTRRLV